MHQALHTYAPPPSSYSLVHLHFCCVSGLCGSCSPLSWLQIFKGVFFQSCPLHFVSNVLPHAIMHLTPDNCFHSIPLVWSQLVLVLQTVICRFVFFEDQKGSFIAIKNRSILFVSLVPFECISATYLSTLYSACTQSSVLSILPCICRRLFNWFAYILFFYNGIAGFVSAILRTLMSVVFSLLLLFRLDQVVLIRGFEQFDFGMCFSW